MLIIFTSSSFLQVLKCGADYSCRKTRCNLHFAPFKKFEQPFGVFFFLVGSFLKNGTYLDKSVLFSLGGKVGITITCLGLPGKGGQDVFLCLCSFECGHVGLLIKNRKMRYIIENDS